MTHRRSLLLLGCGAEQAEALRIARELGYRTIAFDNAANAASRLDADRFEHVDLKDHSALLRASRDVAPDGVFVHAAELAVEAAAVTDALELPGLSLETALDATDKSRRIRKFAEAGILTPRFVVLTTDQSLGEWAECLEGMPFPFVLKPTNQAGARGVERIADSVDLARYYAGREQYGSGTFVCEEHLVGLQLSTESVRVDGRTAHTAIALRHYENTARYLPYFIEDGHSMPFALPLAIRSGIHAVIESAFEALHLLTGVLKGDLLIDEAGRIFVLEMAGRTSGGRFADTVVPLSTGVNILYPLIQLAMGDRFTSNWFEPTRNVGVSQRFFLHDAATRVQRWPHLRRLVGRPGVADWRIDDAKFGSGRLPTIRSHRDRFGYVICTGQTREAADALALDITSDFRRGIQTEPLQAFAQ